MSFSSDTLNYLFHKYNRSDGASIRESIQKSDESIRISILENQILKLTHIIDLQEKRLETHDVILQSLDLSKIKLNIIESDVTSSLSKRGVNFDYNGVLLKILQTNNQHQTNTKGDINSNIGTSQGQPLAMGKEEITLESRQQFLSDMQDINNNIDDAKGKPRCKLELLQYAGAGGHIPTSLVNIKIPNTLKVLHDIVSTFQCDEDVDKTELESLAKIIKTEHQEYDPEEEEEDNCSCRHESVLLGKIRKIN